ncbi:MAG: hypothetical protein HQL19_02430 [Candidatus Omnitrophica bacterium]|nr:hypothetical protein [Candidatus Omnitrophota bacterium]
MNSLIVFFMCCCCLPTSLMAAEVPWHEVKSAHFQVFFKHCPKAFVDSVVASAEQNYHDTMTTLGFTRYKSWTWQNRPKIYVFDGPEDYKGSNMEWSAGTARIDQREIMTFPMAQGFFDSVLPHELGHIIFHEAIGMDNNIPLWLDEGVAMYLEKGQRLGADDAVRQAAREGKFISLEELGSMKLTNATGVSAVQLFYEEAASLVGFLLHRYETYRFDRLCRELNKGTPFEWALPKAYMELRTVSDLEKAWRKYLQL